MAIQPRPEIEPRRAPASPALLLALAAMVTGAMLGCHGPRTRPSDSGPATSGQTTLTSAEAPSPSPPLAPRGVPDIAALVARVSPGVVNITATQEVHLPGGLRDPFEFFFGERQRRGGRDEVMKRRGLGSGFILDATGHVVTNAHVVQDATKVSITLADEREFAAKVRGRDERLDVAILELEGAKDLPHVALGRSEDLRVGDYIVAIGNPFGLGNTVTMGIVSAKSRAIGAGPYDDFIQTDASINPGNSGGPLFNLEGEVVGISTAMAASGQGIGFAIPIDAIKDVLPQLLEKGYVSRGRLGVAIQSIDAPLAKALGLDKPTGALVAEVEPGSPAEKAGLKPKDVVLSVDGTPVVHAQDLPRLVARRAPGTRVTLTVLGRNQSRREVKVVLDELREDKTKAAPPPSGSPPAGRPSAFGLELEDEPQAGVVVRNVDPSSGAAELFEPGDVVLEVNGAPVSSAHDATTRLRAARTDRPVLLKVRRNGRAVYVALEPNKPSTPNK